MLRHLALFVGAAFLLAACKVTVVESPDHAKRPGPDGPRKTVAWAHQDGPQAPEGAKSVRGQRAVEVFRAVGPDGGKSMTLRRMGGDKSAVRDYVKAGPGGPFAAAGCAAACARMQELSAKCTEDACMAAKESARKCCDKGAKGADAEAAKLACLRACATAAAECEDCRKVMARCAAACANQIAGDGPGAMMFGGFGGMPGMPGMVELGDLAVCEELDGAECCEDGACEVTCEVDEATGAQRITVNGKELKLDGQAINLDGASFSVEGATIEVDGAGAPAEGARRVRVARLAPAAGAEAKTIVVREVKEDGKTKVFSGAMLTPPVDPKQALEKAERRIVELKDALKAAEDKLTTAGDDRPALEKKLDALREKLEAAKKHIESLRNMKVKQSESEKKNEEGPKEMKLIRLGGG